MAVDFFNISGSLYVDKSTDSSIRSSAQGLFMLMTNGVGATIGTLGAQAVINAYTSGVQIGDDFYTIGDWQACWFIFAGYALVIALSFALVFRPKKEHVKF